MPQPNAAPTSRTSGDDSPQRQLERRGGDQGGEGPERIDLAVREIHRGEHPVDQREADGDDRIGHADAEPMASCPRRKVSSMKLARMLRGGESSSHWTTFVFPFWSRPVAA